MASKIELIKRYMKKNNKNNDAKICELNLAEMLWNGYITAKEREKLSFFKFTNIKNEKESGYKNSFNTKTIMINDKEYNGLNLKADYLDFFNLLNKLREINDDKKKTD